MGYKKVSYGTFTIPTAKIIKGKIYALDIDPRGPSMDIRLKPEDCLKWAESVGFSGAIRYELKPYHYGIVLSKKEVER